MTERGPSLARRIATAYAAMTATLVAVTCAASVALALHVVGIGFDRWAGYESEQLAVDARALAAHGVPFPEIARIMRLPTQRHLASVRFFDERGRFVGGDPAPPPDRLAAVVAAAFAMRTFDVAVPGGSVRIAPDPGLLDRALERYAMIDVAIAVVGIALAALAGWAIATRAMRPLRGMTAALEAIGEGDFRAKPVVAFERSEVGTLAVAFNRAAARLSEALAARDRAHAELRHFVADAGHELQTPLTVVLGYLDALRNGVVTDPAARETVLDTVTAEARRLRAVVADLVTLARLSAGRAGAPRATSLARVAAEAIAGMPEAWRDRVRAPARDAIALVDRSDALAALRNCLENAARYTTGAIAVEIGDGPELATVAIRDDGPGMTAEDAEHAFDRFFRGGDGRGEGIPGSGLGLAIVRDAVTRCGGTVSLRSSPETGTEIELRFAAARAAGPAATRSRA